MSFNSDTILGALLVGTWASSVLYTVEVIQAAYYYRHFKDENWMLKLLVSSAIVFDSVSMIANYASVYLVCICCFHHMNGLIDAMYSTKSLIGRICRTSTGQFDPLYVFTTGVVAALAQSFLAARYWLLSKNNFITLTLFFFIVVAAGGAFATGATLMIFPRFTDRRKAIIPGTTWLITGAVTDISIALALALELKKVESSFKETRSLVNRLVAQSIQTGTAGATIALAVLVAFLANTESNISTGMAYCLGRVYCITMMHDQCRASTGAALVRPAGRMTDAARARALAELETMDIDDDGNDDDDQ
ncbi:hypothetical protein B0H19DRAFT_1267029 [Mycena capillaripes]|nr:hypothetical protein B0H19DRAFT_1267029 [Mycena capillaripes]